MNQVYRNMLIGLGVIALIQWQERRSRRVKVETRYQVYSNGFKKPIRVIKGKYRIVKKELV